MKTLKLLSKTNENAVNACREILRIVDFNGGLQQGQTLTVCYNSGLHRIKGLCEEATSKEKQGKERERK